MKPLKYENDKYEIFVQNHIFIKDKETNKYFRNKLSSIDSHSLKDFREYKEKISNFAFWSYILFLIMMICFNNLYLLNLQKEIVPYFNAKIVIVLILYFITNIVLHELGHIYSLKYFGKKFDKIGVKLNYLIFPAVFVQMNETYMLSRIDKIVVHSAGIFINFTIINIIQLINEFTLHSYTLSLAFIFFSSTMIWNLVPLLNSDGYKIMLASLSLDEFSHVTKNHWLVIIFQTIGLLIALNTLIHWLIYWGLYFLS
ncbi:MULTISPECIES: peptidase [Staphylococcus]|uniref:Peptidase n=1 Tax=Staphylococcus pettenkoferi TaxID=170573 RepID=A0A2N6QHV1_9STAP|nr:MULTISPECIES: peptidase [Staphylococcus]MCI2791607.1 peptidase [Staphylococcus pettenkoferi]MCY1604467.1 peptidase [Staphylococcus pettenkoferi]OFK76582.1 peptidase [Staphylococcus sp. HMSC071G07]PMC19106.1 peptidase [Staphylococcus pettenkoferi]